MKHNGMLKIFSYMSAADLLGDRNLVAFLITCMASATFVLTRVNIMGIGSTGHKLKFKRRERGGRV